GRGGAGRRRGHEDGEHAARHRRRRGEEHRRQARRQPRRRPGDPGVRVGRSARGARGGPLAMIELVERPDETTWDERRLWLAQEEERAARGGAAGRLSEQATALMVDLQRCYCAGAWAAAVVLAGAIVDAQTLYAGFP